MSLSNHFACQGLGFERIGLPNLNNVLTMIDELGRWTQTTPNIHTFCVQRRSPDMDSEERQVLSNP